MRKVIAAQTDTVPTVVQTAMATACQSNTPPRGVPPATRIAEVNCVGIARGLRILAPGTPNRTSHLLNRARPLESGFTGATSCSDASASPSVGTWDARRFLTASRTREVRMTIKRTHAKLHVAAAIPAMIGLMRPITPTIAAPSPSTKWNCPREHDNQGLHQIRHLSDEVLEGSDQPFKRIHSLRPLHDCPSTRSDGAVRRGGVIPETLRTARREPSSESGDASHNRAKHQNRPRPLGRRIPREACRWPDRSR